MASQWAGLQFTALGVEFAATVVVAVWLGYRVDDYFGTTPWLTMLFVVAGMLGAVQRLLWSLKRHSSRQSHS
jgi:F0F1-type ATP synthase assembly protein I